MPENGSETPRYKIPALTVVAPVYVFTEPKANLPRPDLVKVVPVPEITPLIRLSPLSPLTLIETTELDAVAISLAVKVPAVTLNPVIGVEPPTTPIKVVFV